MIGVPMQIVMMLMKTPKDKLYEIKEYRQKRSLNQNAYYWTLLEKLAGKLKTSKTELHNRMLQDYGVVETFGGKAARFLLPDTDETESDVLKKHTVHLKPTSQTTVLKDGIRYRTYVLLKGSHDMDTKQMADLLNGCVQECLAQDIETMTPRELEELRRIEEQRERKNKSNSDSNESEAQSISA